MAKQKVTQKQLLEFLAQHGLADVEVVADDATDTSFNGDELLSMLDASREPIISQKVISAKQAELNKAAAGKMHNAYRKALNATFGIDISAIDGKEASEAVSLALEHFKSTLGDSDKASSEQMQKIMAAHAEEIKAEREARAAEKNSYEDKIAKFGINKVLSNMYASASKIPSTLKKDVLQEDFLNYIDGKYKLSVSEDGNSIHLFDKANPTQRVLTANNGQFLDINDVHKEYHTVRGQWHEDARGINPAKASAAPPVNNFPIKGAGGNIVSETEQKVAAMNEWASAKA